MHKITNVDEIARTGTCSVCGLVSVNVRTKRGDRIYWRCAEKDRDNSRRLMGAHGLTMDESRARNSGKVCEFCGNGPTVTDHDHKTGRLRGNLCRSCNLSLGHIEANLHRLAVILAYLKHHSSHHSSFRLRGR